MSLSMNAMSLVRPHERDDLGTATFQNATFRFPHRFSPVLLAEPALGRSSPLGARADLKRGAGSGGAYGSPGGGRKRKARRVSAGPFV